MRFWIEMAPLEDQKTTSFLPAKSSVFGQLQLRLVCGKCVTEGHKQRDGSKM